MPVIVFWFVAALMAGAANSPQPAPHKERVAVAQRHAVVHVVRQTHHARRHPYFVWRGKYPLPPPWMQIWASIG